MGKQSFWERCWKDKQGKQAIIQPANAPLIGWAAFTLLSKVIAGEAVKDIVEFIAFACLLVWASLEVISGASYLRRALGFLVLLLAIYSRVV